jgi:hypothetical protein
MPLMSPLKTFRKFTTVVIGIIAVLTASSGVSEASYGPPAPPVVPVPGGYYCVATSQTVGQPGKLIASLPLHRMVARLRIARGTFLIPVQVTITEPYGLSGVCRGRPDLGDAGHAGYWAVGGIGILVQRSGTRYGRAFAKPLVLSLRSRWITRRSLVVVWNGGRFAIARHAVVRRRQARIRVRANADFAVLSPLRTSGDTDALPRRTARTPATSEDFVAALLRMPGDWQHPGLGIVTSAGRYAPIPGAMRRADQHAAVQ